MKKIIIKAPLSGVIFPLEEVPDEVFAQKMVGDGISIDPSSNILNAPIDGVVTYIHKALHAITIRHNSGLEVMIHIGLDTVELKAKGFKSLTKEGEEVNIGDSLIEFDMEYVDRHAKALLTQIILTNGDMVESIEKSEGYANCSETTLMVVELKDNMVAPIDLKSPSNIASEQVVISNHLGLHARPSATLASICREFQADISLHKDQHYADAKSVISILKLDIRYGDEIEIKVSGESAEDILSTIATHLQKEIKEEEREVVYDRADIDTSHHSKDTNILKGISASSGISVGVATHMSTSNFEFEEYASDSKFEIERLNKAIDDAKDQLNEIISARVDKSSSDIFLAHIELLDDEDIIAKAKEYIIDGSSADHGWSRAYQEIIKELKSIPNPMILERSYDIQDIGERVMRCLSSDQDIEITLIPNSIVLARYITPSILARLDIEHLSGLCTATGGATSHVAIMARSMGVPYITSIGEELMSIEDGSDIIIDATEGTIFIKPTISQMREANEKRERSEYIKIQNLKDSSLNATTTDGHRVSVVANISSVEDATKVVEFGGEGVGLLRSEFLFLDRAKAPSEDEQFEIYRDIVVALDGRELVVRTLDVGGDKPLSYISMPHEENPFLGIRGIRISMQRVDIFRDQIRAILRASEYGVVRIMFPMISTIDEIREVKDIVERERVSLGVEPIEIGIMVEVPSVAILAQEFAKEVDFFSIGSNDLIQYTLAIDRGHPQLASKLNTLDPSILKLIKLTIDGAKKEGIRVAICGGIASDPTVVPLLIGLGIDELSVTLPTISTIKAEIRKLSISECKRSVEDIVSI